MVQTRESTTASCACSSLQHRMSHEWKDNWKLLRHQLRTLQFRCEHVFNLHHAHNYTVFSFGIGLHLDLWIEDDNPLLFDIWFEAIMCLTLEKSQSPGRHCQPLFVNLQHNRRSHQSSLHKILYQIQYHPAATYWYKSFPKFDNEKMGSKFCGGISTYSPSIWAFLLLATEQRIDKQNSWLYIDSIVK